MSQNIPTVSVSLPSITLDGKHTQDQIEQASKKLNRISWYLCALRVEALFEAFPCLADVGVENEGRQNSPHPYFMEGDLKEDAEPSLDINNPTPQMRERLNHELEALGDEIFAMHMKNPGIVEAVAQMCNKRHIHSYGVLEQFGQMWKETHRDDPAALDEWNAMLAEIQTAQLEATIQAPPAPGKPMGRF